MRETRRLREPDDAGVCLLTPGPMNETYFGNTTARYLGLRLVEGADFDGPGRRSVPAHHCRLA